MYSQGPYTCSIPPHAASIHTTAEGAGKKQKVGPGGGGLPGLENEEVLACMEQVFGSIWGLQRK